MPQDQAVERLISSVEGLLDRIEICDLLSRYASVVDGKAYDALVEIFTPDATAYYRYRPERENRRLVGRGEIIAFLADALVDAGATQHLLANHRISIVGDTATSQCVGRVMHFSAADPTVTYESFCRYDDTLRRTDAGWRISSRVHRLVSTLGDPDQVLRLRRTVE